MEIKTFLPRNAASKKKMGGCGEGGWSAFERFLVDLGISSFFPPPHRGTTLPAAYNDARGVPAMTMATAMTITMMLVEEKEVDGRVVTVVTGSTLGSGGKFESQSVPLLKGPLAHQRANGIKGRGRGRGHSK